MTRRYSSEQMEEILRRAMQREVAGEITHEELVDAASEVGIDPSAIEAAARELEAEHGSREQLARARADLKKRALSAFGNYLVLNALCFAGDALTGPPQWFHWVLLGSTALLLRRVFLSLFPSERELERATRRLHKRQERALKHQNRAAWHRSRHSRQKQTAEQFERAVDEGLQALLKVAGDKLEQYNRTSAPPTPRVRVSGEPHATAQEPDDDRLRNESHTAKPRSR